MAKESALRQRIMLLLKEEGFFAQAIESSTNPGMPDIWWLVDGISGWVECKMVTSIPKRAETSLFASANHNLSPEQENWIARCLAKLGNAAILVAHERRYFLVPGQLAAVFNSFTMRKLEEYEVAKKDIPTILRGNHAKQLSDHSGGPQGRRGL